MIIVDDRYKGTHAEFKAIDLYLENQTENAAIIFKDSHSLSPSIEVLKLMRVFLPATFDFTD